MRFRNTLNGYEERASMPFLWTLISGPIYFIYKGVWRHVLLYLLFNALLITIVSFAVGGAGMLAMAAVDAATHHDPQYDGARTGGYVAVVVAALVLPFLIYPFLATGIIRRHYLRRGWEEVS